MVPFQVLPWCWLGELMYILGIPGPLQWTLLWDWQFCPPLQPPQIFTARGFEALVSHTGILGCVVWLTPKLLLPIYQHTNVELPSLPAAASPPPPNLSTSRCFATCCLHSSCPSPHLLPVWINVSSATHWLSDFHMVQCSGSSWVFFLDWLLFFIWLCEETKHIYLHQHLGQKPKSFLF